MSPARTILLAASFSLPLLACAEPETPLSELPELPAELASDLEPDPTAPVLRSRPARPAPPELPPQPPQPAVDVPSSCKTKYLTQAIYPVVTCHPPSELTDQVVAQAAAAGGPRAPAAAETLGEIDRVELAVEPRFFKLSSSRGERLSAVLFCRVHGGPWSATVERRSQCSIHLPAIWELEVPAVDLVLSWFGEWEDLPSYPSLYVVQGDLYQLGEESCSCCGGYQYCKHTQSCIPQTVECKPPVIQ